jgi:pimeloyl-ACP methyl ester carboxylesterase
MSATKPRRGRSSKPTLTLRHYKRELAVWRLRDGEGRPLLLLHGLGERTPPTPPAVASEHWSGPIWGLDFTGHGASTVPVGGGYTAETFMADADVVLAELGPVTVVGRGLGAYVALLLAGARPSEVRGAVLADGTGLAGGGIGPVSPTVVVPPERWPADAAPDPFALVELTHDVRPPDYATSYVRQAVQFSGLDEPITVSAIVRPTWLAAVAGEPGVVERPMASALARYADVT